MAWWSRKKESLERDNAQSKVSVPKGLWSKCESCGEITYTDELVQNLRVCPVCGHHATMPTSERIASMVDSGTWTEHDTELRSGDPLGFFDSAHYKDRIDKAVKQSGSTEAFRSGVAEIDGVPVSAGFFAFEFMGGSMGSVVGEKVTRVFERALDLKRPAIVYSASGGARMQEGVLSLMQMAKTSAARARLRDAKLPYISVVLHPTTGGVAASFAMLGDVILAEPRALVGFAGPRVIAQTIGQELPKGFQRAEFLVEHGMIDRIVSRLEMREAIGSILRLLLGVPTKQPAAPRTVTAFAELFARRSLGVRLGLETVVALYETLGRPADGVPAVHVVGTNGKGSTTACCAHALARAGRRVGAFTSPHLHRVGERVRIQAAGSARAEEDDDAVLGRAIDGVLALERTTTLPRPLSFFEILTLAAWVRFAEEGVDAIVAEAGMGGRFDATRICSARVVVVTSIDLDHQAYLGPTRTAIAQEKAAVLRKDVPCFTGPQTGEAATVLREAAASVGAPLWWIAPLPRAPAGLVGAHQRHNGALAAAAAAVLQPGIVARDVDGVVWPGRYETLPWQGGTLVLDVAHNAAGIAALAAELARRDDRARLSIAVGCVADKDATPIVATLALLDRPLAWVDLRALGGAGTPTPAPTLESLADADALFAWIQSRLMTGGTVCVCGSHVLVAAVRAAALGLPAAAPNDPR